MYIRIVKDGNEWRVDLVNANGTEWWMPLDTFPTKIQAEDFARRVKRAQIRYGNAVFEEIT